MGIIELGIPKKIVLDLKNLFGSTQFVETGTLFGSTSKWASDHFKMVHTIELSKTFYDQYSGELQSLKNIKPYLGDSRDVLPAILSEIGDQKIVFWLDGHWSAGETAGEEDECPLLGELNLIANRKGDIILIDDARYFLSSPGQPHNPDKWPTMSDIVKLLDTPNNRRYIQIVDDVIFAIPYDEIIKPRLTEYAATQTAKFWEDYVNLHKEVEILHKEADSLHKEIEGLHKVIEDLLNTPLWRHFLNSLYYSRKVLSKFVRERLLGRFRLS